MWEPSSSSSSSSSSNSNSNSSSNRGIVLLIIAVSACILIYKAWGPLLLITCALVLVVHTCYSLLVNDSLLAPHTLILLRYSREIAIEITQTVRVLFNLSYTRCSGLLEYLKHKYEEKYKRKFHIKQSTQEIMNGIHKNAYKLSTMNPEFDDDVSPIHNDPYHLFAVNGACDIARTSTPISTGLSWKKTTQQNGDLGLFASISDAKKISHLRTENRPPGLTHARSEETLYNKGSHWVNNTSPKLRDRVAGIKTVQTIAGPLLASTRYNIDPKIYADISSPGLTSRLTKYATEANNKLTHQSQYGTGQFPKVNLNASPTPLINTKVARARMPVTVRIAPPETINYSPSENHITQDRSKMFPNISPPEAKESKSCPSVAQVLKVMSLKRHATVEDKVIDMLAKKQRMERAEGQLENLEEMMQKRARDDSLTSEDDLSPQSKTQRPLKRSKASSCHDILNSLSSSISVVSGVKRKAMDSSRCSTPENEKHFKSSSMSPNRSTSLIYHSSEEHTNIKEQFNVNVSNQNSSGEPCAQKNSLQDKSLEIIKNVENPVQSQTDSSLNSSKVNVAKEISNASKSPKLTDKLFMRAEPCPHEKLKNLIEEQSSIEAKFTRDGNDEIKKQDIVNMRQTNMRQRLQSMFDAISGKSASKIDPDVVIQAEEVSPSTSSTYTVLSSSTSTTTVNTSPILTTIVPILKTDNDQKGAATKHVSFNLPTSSSLSKSTIPSSTSLQPSKEVIMPEKTKTSESSGTSIFQGFAASAVSAPSVNSSNSVVPLSTPSSTVSSSSTSIPQSTGSSFNFLTTPSISTATTKNESTTIKTTESNNSFKANTTESPRASVIVVSSGFSFGQSPKSIVTSATAVSSAPPTSVESQNSTFGNSVTVPSFGNQMSKNPANTFVAPSIVTKNDETNFGNNVSIPSFGSQLSKSPANTSIKPTTNTFGTGKEGDFSFGSTSSTNNTSNTTTITKSQSTPIFGMASSSPMFSAGNSTTSTVITTTLTTQAPTFTFGAGTSKSTSGGFSFGATSTATATTTPAVFSSSVSTLPNVSSSSAAPSTFGALVATTSINNTPSTTSSPMFGNSTSSLFGASANSPSLFSGSTNAGATFIFKSPTTIAAPSTSTTIFNSQTSPTAFGTAATTPAAQAAISTAPSLFGNISNSNTTTTAAPTIFGNTTGTNPPAATTPFYNPMQQQAPQGNLFSGVNATTSATPSIFGSTTTATPTGLFSGASASPATSNLTSTANPPENTNIFGQTKAPASLSFGATSPTFGSTNPSTSFSVPSVNNNGNSAFSMGSAPSASTLPSFNAIKSTPQFGTQPNSLMNASTNAPASSTTSIFGAASNAFGASAASSSAFGGTSATSGGFGMQSSASFGAPSTSGISPFSSQPTTTANTSLFGNAAPAAGSVSFTFGGAQPAQTQQPQQPLPQQPTATFSFGGTSNNNPAPSGGLFQFGGSNAAKQTGFNFNPPTAAPAINFTGSTAPPAFNAPTTNMFSIGSGSSTPRSRTSRPRRQR